MAWGGEAPTLDSQEAQQQQQQQQQHPHNTPSCTVDLVVTCQQSSHAANASQALSASAQPFVGLK
eukprot:833515-Pelagomonas_calceolata.AAC.1